MRSTLDIRIAVSENQSVTEQELRYALHALGHIHRFIEDDLRKLSDAVLDNKNPDFVRLRARFARGTMENMFDAAKKPVDEWLGPDNLPGSLEQQRRLTVGKKIFKKATGVDLDEQ